MEWIKCSDRMPKVNQSCWIFENHEFVIHAYFDIDVFRWGSNDDRIELDEVSHWMPYFTPDPPKE